MNKIYTAKVVQIVESGDAILQFPKNMIENLHWKVGDRLEIDIINDQVIMKNVSAMLRNNTQENNN